MDVELTGKLRGSTLERWEMLLRQAGLEPDTDSDSTVLIRENGQLIAAGSRKENLLKCIAVDDAYQGEGLTATLLSTLRQDAFQEGYKHLFLYTKPQNRYLFGSLFFHPIAETKQVLLMETPQGGIERFLQVLPVCAERENVGAVVMNCNPFTKGHRYLIETAASECDRLYVFVISEDKSIFSAKDRMKMVMLGTADLPNVTVLPTGPYLISSATFPTYFLKDRENAEAIHCLLDIEIFCNYYVPKFGITRRYVGTEPLSPMTRQYNDALKKHLPEKGIALREIPRLEQNGMPISASEVRALLQDKNFDALRELLPESTYTYITQEA